MVKNSGPHTKLQMDKLSSPRCNDVFVWQQLVTRQDQGES